MSMCHDNIHFRRILTYFGLSILHKHYILEEPNSNYSYAGLCDSAIPTDKWLNYLLTEEPAMFANYPSGGLQTKMG